MTLSSHEILESAETPKKTKGCRNGCGCCFIILLILALPFWWFCLHTTPLKVSKETTYVLGPMKSDGKQVDYFLAMEERFYPPEMKTDDNGYRMMVRACGVCIEPSRLYQDSEGRWHEEKIDLEPIRIQVYEKLGLDPKTVPTLKLEEPWNILSQYDKDHPPAEGEVKHVDKFKRAAMWTFEDFPMLKDWLEENTAGIDLLGEAARKPVFYIPYTRENEDTILFECQSGMMSIMRTASRAAAARAKYRLGTGNIDGAIDDIMTVHHLARHIGKHGTLVVSLTGLGTESGARSIGIARHPDFPPTKEQIERFIAEINALPPRGTLEDALKLERYFSLAALQDIFFSDSSNLLELTAIEEYFSGMMWICDVNICFARINEMYDALPRNEVLPEIVPLSGGDLLSFPFVQSRSNRFMDRMIALFIPAVEAWNASKNLLECSENLQRLTLALLLYEKDHGSMPDGDWREAVKPYLGENPEQYFRCPAKNLAEDETTYTMIEGVTYSASSAEQIILIEVPQPQKLGEGNGRIPLEDVMAMLFQEDTISLVDSVHPNRITVGYHSGQVTSLQFHMKLEDDLRKLLEGDTE